MPNTNPYLLAVPIGMVLRPINMSRLYLVIACIMLSQVFFAQRENRDISGVIYGISEKNEPLPLFGANAYWLGTTVGDISDENGAFSIPRRNGDSLLVVSYIGYKSDTIFIGSQTFLEIGLRSVLTLNEVEVAQRTKSTVLKTLTPVKYEVISEKELLKAACCNLSESFETSPSVDVSFTDAITGTRQIQMLGLAGPYSQITRENMPDVRGLSSIYGLTFIPGTWVESIQLNKGTGSVTNGFESIAGQINVELRKPESADRMYFNVYGNEGGRAEMNLNLAQKLNEKWSTAVLLHAQNNSFQMDRNQDGFIDHPLSRQYIGLNRWKYIDPNGLRMQFGLKGTHIDNIGGQMDYDPDIATGMQDNANEIWGMTMNLRRYEAWAKLGKVYEDTPWKSLGAQVSGSFHKHDSQYGATQYDAQQQSYYANFIYQSIIGNTNHNFKTGASLQYDDFIEDLNSDTYVREEFVPGVFFEYTYSFLEKFDVVSGVRVDYHNMYGAFLTPRIHVRYAPVENTIFRASMGRGQRTASIFSENSGVFASARQIIVRSEDPDLPYGLSPEVAWNYGFNFTQKFMLDYREGSISADFYRTDFQNQIVVDMENPRSVVFYNLNGLSYSNSIQTQLDYELIKRLDIRIAYRWYDVQTDYDSGLERKPLVASHRAFANLAYGSRNHWRFDYTFNWQGAKRLPSTSENPVQYQRDISSPSFFVMNAQVSKTWNEKFEFYLGVENLLNFKQSDAIIAQDQPFGEYFDAALIWGPVFGRNTYAGIRYMIK